MQVPRIDNATERMKGNQGNLHISTYDGFEVHVINVSHHNISIDDGGGANGRLQTPNVCRTFQRLTPIAAKVSLFLTIPCPLKSHVAI